MQDYSLVSARDMDGLLRRSIETFLEGRGGTTLASYRERLSKFFAWYQANAEGSFDFADLLARYLGHLKAQTHPALSERSIQAHLNTLKGLIRVMAAKDPELSQYLPQLDLVKAPQVRGVVQGERLSEAQRNLLINLPGLTTLKGMRDSLVLELQCIIGLRRSEVTGLNWGHLAELEGHHVLKNIKGKHGRIRTVKLPVQVWRLMMLWREQSGIDTAPDSPLLVAIRKGDHVQHGQRMTPQAIKVILDDYARQARQRDFAFPEHISPHDLRRTAAALSRCAGAPIEKVQLMLGHASPQTTSQYIGGELNLDDNAVDYGKVAYPERAEPKQAQLPLPLEEEQ